MAVGVVLFAVVGGGAWLVRPGPPPRITGVRPLATRTAPSPWGNDVLTDGERVYYLTAERDQVTLHQVAGTGGEVVDIPLLFRDPAFLLGTIPGESALLVGGSQTESLPTGTEEGWPLWRVPVPAGAPQRVGDLLAVSADGSPDGRSLALMRNRSIVLASLDGSELRELCRLAGPGNRVRWSPDGTRIRFSSSGPGSSSEQWIWEISATGGSPRPLWPGHWGAWVGDRHYVFDRPPTHDLFVATESRWAPWWPSRPQQLTSGPLRYGCFGASRDGRRLFAGFSPSQPAGGGTLMRYDQAAKLFEPALGGESAIYAEPSPDGQWLAWVRFPEGTLWRSRPDGSERLQLTRLPAWAHLPRWSPDGTRLAFASQTDPSKPDIEIRVVTADGSKTDLIARPNVSAGVLWDPCWLPDDSILFSHQAAPSGLLRFDPLTHRVEPVPGAARLLHPKCSPQGDVLATSNDEQGARWKLRRSGTAEWRDVGPSRGAYPNWTRDGRSICSLSLPSRRIDCLRLDTGRVDPITDTSTVQLAVWVVVPWMGLDAQDRPLVTATTTRSTNLYALDWERRRSRPLRFRKEAHALSRLSHPHVAHLLDFDSEDGIDFLVMELVAGSSLDAGAATGTAPGEGRPAPRRPARPRPPGRPRPGVVHRDLKPSNLAPHPRRPPQDPRLRPRAARRPAPSQPRPHDRDRDGRGGRRRKPALHGPGAAPRKAPRRPDRPLLGGRRPLRARDRPASLRQPQRGRPHGRHPARAPAARRARCPPPSRPASSR